MFYRSLVKFTAIFLLIWTAMPVQGNLGQAKAASNVVTDIRIGTFGNQTRVVFEFTEPISIKFFALDNPYRIVVDMPEVGWRLPSKPLPSAIGVFLRLRYGLYKPGNSRVVLDLKGPVLVSHAGLMAFDEQYGHRLVIELKSTTKAKFNEALKKRIFSIPSKNSLNRSSTATLFKAPTLPSRKLKIKTKSFGNHKTKIGTRSFQIPPRKPPHKSKKVRPYTVMIDPGHGGLDPGAIGLSGIYEKSVTLAMARELRIELKKYKNINVVLTRDRDVFVPLRERIRLARKAETDLFISIHADSIKNSNISGPSVYTLSERASDKEAAMLAEKENKVDLIAGIDLSEQTPDVTGILIDLAQRETKNRSVRFAGKLIKALKKRTSLLRKTHRFAGFVVLKAPDVPSVLLELGFLSSPKDERALQDHRYRAHLAAGIAEAVNAYFARIEPALGR